MSHLRDTEIWAFSTGELTAAEEQAAGLHLRECDACQRALAVVAGFRLSAREAGRLPSAFESARMAKKLRAQVQQETRVQRQAWLPSKVAAAVAFATLSGAAVAMTATGTWTIFSGDARRPQAPIARSFAHTPQPLAAPLEEVPQLAIESTAIEAEQLSDASPLAAEVPTADAIKRPSESRSAPSNRDSAALGNASRGRRVRAASAPTVAGVAAASRAADKRLPLKANEAKGTAKIAMLNEGVAPVAREPELPAAQREVVIEPGTPSPLALLQAEERRLAGENERAGWLPVGDAYIQMADAGGAVRAYVHALAGPEGSTAAQRLRTMVSKGLRAEDELLGVVSKHGDAAQSREGLRLLCEWSLKMQPDRQAVRYCQAFGQAYPAHPSVHRLALAAGLVAENHLQDWELAVEEYSRALVVSEFAELPSSDALFFRARARARLGQIREARADLRLFLHVDSSSWNRKEVDDLMRTLQISRE